MATYSTLRKGNSNKEETKILQQALKDKGYGSYLGSAGVDGIYGSGTDAGVRAFQKDNNLTVDGIVGNQTWSALMGGNNTGNTQQAQQSQQSQPAAAPDYSKYEYNPSNNEAFNYADAMLKEAQGKINTPTYDMSALEDAYNAIVNRDKFTYDVNSDAMYQQYRDLYNAQGKLAQLDAQGQAAALTGGYGSSYAQSVGQQAYQNYMQKLNEVVPELYGMAYDQYQQEGQNLKDRYAMIKEMEDTRYGIAQNEQDAAWKAMDYWQGVADSEYSKGAENYYTGIQLGTQADETAYNRKQNEYKNLVNKMASTGYVPTKEEREAAGMTDGEVNAWANAYKQQMAAAAASSNDATVKYSKPLVGSEEYEEFLKAYETRGEDAAMSFAEAYNIDPAIVVEWLEMARFEMYGDNYYDPGA